MTVSSVSGSFRDPSGVVFRRNGVLLRQINPCYQAQYDRLMTGGLYEKLVRAGVLVRHEEVDEPGITDGAYKVIRPQELPFVSYPYEWSFGAYRDAAITTLKIHRTALQHGMLLKDASAYNVMPYNGKTVLIDTLSFELYRDGEPWGAYGQFCRHFLAPLMLMAYTDLRLSALMRVYIDGIPLDLAATLLHGKGGFAATQHIRWHAKATAKHADDGSAGTAQGTKASLSLSGQTALVESLIRIVEGLRMKETVTEWADYYAHTNYSDTASDSKKQVVSEFLALAKPETAMDFGANDGTYSRLALAAGAKSVVAFDIDPIAVERSWQTVKKSREAMLPLLLDLTNPSPALGFGNSERDDVPSRRHPDCAMMLAVIHHMAISNNVPMPAIAAWLSGFVKRLIIEFVPKEDSQVQKLLATRADIFPDYTKEGFEAAFAPYFTIERQSTVAGSCRTMYLMKAN